MSHILILDPDTNETLLRQRADGVVKPRVAIDDEAETDVTEDSPDHG